MNETLATQRYLNQSALKQHALRCSAELRAGKFERVGQSFLDEVQAEVECLVRHIDNKSREGHHNNLLDDAACGFVTGELQAKLRTVLDNAVARIIQRKVESHPSVGKTLQGK